MNVFWIIIKVFIIENYSKNDVPIDHYPKIHTISFPHFNIQIQTLQ
jgi:hypothetical protein